MAARDLIAPISDIVNISNNTNSIILIFIFLFYFNVFFFV